MYFLGIDIGSTASKAVIINDDKKIIGKGIFEAGAGTNGPNNAEQYAMKDAGISADQITFACATGYGRHLLAGANFEVSELSCHAKGASHLFPGVRTVIDIGGQDAKVLKVGEDGNLQNFVMNDKCAAGTGRFLDVMARVFGCKVSDLSDLDKQSKKMAQISSTCTVFAESEVISKLSSGCSIPDVAAGADQSVVERTAGLVRRLGTVDPIAMTGGVSLNSALVDRLSKKLGHPILTSSLSQYNGAYGASLYAFERFHRK